MRKLFSTRILYLLMIFVGFSVCASAQSVRNADVQFELHAYDLAIDSYLSYLESSSTDSKAMLNLAIAYERTNDMINAARWFEKSMLYGGSPSDEVKLKYGRVLKSLGLYDKAKTVFMDCEDPAYSEMALFERESCDFAKLAMSQKSDYLVYLYRPSSKESDFAPGIWKGQLVFASFETGEEEDADLCKSIIRRPHNNLIIGNKTRKAKNTRVMAFGTDLLEKTGISSCHFTSDNKKVLFTRNNFQNNNRQIFGDEKGMSIYLADVTEDGDFINEHPLPFNDTAYSTAFACFGEDENTIIFSSNMAGDHSNFDLYTSTFDGEQWNEIHSLGSLINTPGNEVSPFYLDGKLYFSSDYLPGLGAYDVFSSIKYEDSWSRPENMGKGINSLGDDLYLIKSADSNEYYYTSNRLGGKGKYDIYISIDNNPDPVTNMFAAIETKEDVHAPASISLQSMEEGYSTNINMSNAILAGYRDNIIAPNDISLDGATLISYGEVLNSTSRVYFIQLASLAHKRSNVAKYKSLIEYGNVYRIKKNSSYKIRLGYYHGQSEANSILAIVRKKGFRDAFLIEDVLNVKELELLISRFTFESNKKYEKPSVESVYKVRLAAYSNPLYFDTEKVKDIGVIEQWSKGKWTIFILSGFSTIEDAKSAKIKAYNRGFTGAELVRDDEGILTRVKEN